MRYFRTCSRILAYPLIALFLITTVPLAPARAAIIGTEDVLQQGSLPAAREKVVRFLERVFRAGAHRHSRGDGCVQFCRAQAVEPRFMTRWPGGPQCSGLDMTTLALGSMEACHSYLNPQSGHAACARRHCRGVRCRP